VCSRSQTSKKKPQNSESSMSHNSHCRFAQRRCSSAPSSVAFTPSWASSMPLCNNPPNSPAPAAALPPCLFGRHSLVHCASPTCGPCRLTRPRSYNGMRWWKKKSM
jgi:hypothetical protein